MLQRSLRQFADHLAQREDHRGRERLGVVAMAAAITMFTRLQQGCQRGEVLLPQEFRRCFVLHFPVVRKWTEIGTRRMFGVRKLFYSMLASNRRGERVGRIFTVWPRDTNVPEVGKAS